MITLMEKPYTLNQDILFIIRDTGRGTPTEAPLCGGDVLEDVSGDDVVYNFHERFLPKEEVMEIICSLKHVHTDLIKKERAIERFTVIVDEYQEQPHLVDPHLEEIINTIISTARQPSCEDGHVSLLFTCLHLLTKMRGYKVIVRYLPHEVSDVETVLELLQKQDPSNVTTWQNRYCLLLWLSMVSMIPFDLVRLDNTVGDGDNKLPVMDRILDIGKLYLCVTDKSCDAAAYMLAKFLTRPDVKKRRMGEVIDWAITSLTASAHGEMVSGFTGFTTNAVIGGTLRMLALLFKNGNRDDLIPHAGRILEMVTHEPVISQSSNIIVRKLGVKLLQRIGLIYLKARVASWRYSRGNRSLATNLAGGSKAGPQQAAASQQAEEDEDYDLPDEIEDVIEWLLNSLKDKDTIVRWSAAKGIGRITGRLPRELADDIIASLLELFTIQETDASWHGGCLALAELGRRGLLLPQRLPEVIPVIKKSLNFDEKKGNFSVGAHVRDAACYVCWSFARAYEPEHFREYALQIASALLIVTVFDKGVNVRRAASAAFQENVGRQGTFPHGIDIVTTCDYFAVGLITNTYLELSKFVAGFPEYTHTLMDHLVVYKIRHWSSDLRVLSSKAFYKLTPLDTDYIKSVVLEQLLPLAVGTDLNTRHGAILSIGQICLCLTAEGISVEGHVLELIAQIEPTLRSRKQLLGMGGDIMKKGLCSMIGDVCEAKLFKSHHVIGCWQSLLDECLIPSGLIYLEPEVQGAAIKALPHLLSMSDEDVSEHSAEDIIIDGYISKMLTPSSELARIGAAAALGVLPASFLQSRLNKVFAALMHCTRQGDFDKDWADARNAAFNSITSVCKAVGIEADGSPDTCVCQGNIDEIYDSYLLGLRDYTIDSRGDVGAGVRETCMSGIEMLTSAVAAKAPNLLHKDFVKRVFTMIAQQACEKIDRTRDLAGRILTTLLHYQPEIPHVPCRRSLERIFPSGDLERINFAAPSATFPRFSKLLDLDEYRYHVLLGFTVSVGGLTESLVKHSNLALLDHIQADTSSKCTRLKTICDAITQIFSNHTKVDRVTVPLMKMIGQLLASGVLDDLVTDTEFSFPLDVLQAIKAEISQCRDPQKILTAGEVLCGLLMFQGVIREKCLYQLAIFLCHKFPIVRKTTASDLYECLITNDEVISDTEKSEKVMSLLSDIEWDEPLEKIRPVRNELCGLLGISTPVVVKKLQKPSS